MPKTKEILKKRQTKQTNKEGRNEGKNDLNHQKNKDENYNGLLRNHTNKNKIFNMFKNFLFLPTFPYLNLNSYKNNL